MGPELDLFHFFAQLGPFFKKMNDKFPSGVCRNKKIANNLYVQLFVYKSFWHPRLPVTTYNKNKLNCFSFTSLSL